MQYDNTIVLYNSILYITITMVKSALIRKTGQGARGGELISTDSPEKAS